MRRRTLPWLLLCSAALVSLLAAACGGGGATATPAVTARPIATTTPPATSPAATPTSAPTAAPTVAPPTPTPTPLPGAAVPTPIRLPPGKRGGVLSLQALFTPTVWDTLDPRGQVDFHTMGPMLNNLLWPDPYGDGYTLVGDTAESWEIGQGGTTITFRLRKGITWHDGTPFSAADVAYNIDRAWHPRTPTTTVLKPALQAIKSIETPDDSTVRLTLAVPSNALLRSMSTQLFLLFPSHMPFPDKQEAWRAKPIGTGPFKFKGVTANVNIEYVRHDNYWRQGFPYLDGLLFIVMGTEPATAALRTGRLDAGTLTSTPIERAGPEKLAAEQKFVLINITNAMNRITINSRPPWNDARVRQAMDLATSRQDIVTFWLEGRGTPYAAPAMPPEFGGQWGISIEEMKKRPGYREDKTQDLATAKKLLADAGVDPSKVTVNITGTATYPQYTETFDASVRALGFKTKVDILVGAAGGDRLGSGQFDLDTTSSAMHYDDPADYLAPWVVTGGGFNFGKWSDAEIDRLYAEQDRALDVAKRKDLMRQLQERVLETRFILPLNWRRSYQGYMPWVKNFPQRLPFLYSPWFRWEQVWVDK